MTGHTDTMPPERARRLESAVEAMDRLADATPPTARGHRTFAALAALVRSVAGMHRPR